jgi:hypothetical protein
VIVEPRVGGRWYERGEDGSESESGRVLVWESRARLVLAWQVNGQGRFDPGVVTKVEIRFIPDGTAARVELGHRNIERFGDRAEVVCAAFESPKG